MIELYTHKVTSSFYLWFDYTLLKKAQAFQNVSANFFYLKDDRVDDSLVTYSSPFKQWVTDSSITNAVIPSGVSGAAGFISRDSGAILDFEQGRVFLDSGYGLNSPISGSFAVKDFNTYIVTQEEQSWVFENKYQLNGRYGIIPETGVSPYDYALPACFIAKSDGKNVPFAFGGEQDSQSKFRVIVVAENLFKLDGCLSLFRDQAESNIPLLSMRDLPLNEYGDLKSGVYNYESFLTNPERMVFLEKVVTSFITRDTQKSNNLNLKFGIIDFYLSEPRFPKQDI